jgi:hypothetical protein
MRRTIRRGADDYRVPMRERMLAAIRGRRLLQAGDLALALLLAGTALVPWS